MYVCMSYTHYWRPNHFVLVTPRQVFETIHWELRYVQSGGGYIWYVRAYVRTLESLDAAGERHLPPPHTCVLVCVPGMCVSTNYLEPETCALRFFRGADRIGGSTAGSSSRRLERIVALGQFVVDRHGKLCLVFVQIQGNDLGGSGLL